ncbi:hypothetical protein BH11PLA1_BH11PLA1_17510 [soil metagenome]
MIPFILEQFGAAFELLRLTLITRARFRGPYWQWRAHTAFGRGYPASRLDLAASIWSYARWCHRMRSGR